MKLHRQYCRINILSLFSGIGAFEKALQRVGVGYELVNYCEIDKYASKAYSLIHNEPESKNLGNVTTIDTSKLEDIDMITYGFPCQDISLAGKLKGFTDEDGKVTRSGLFFEALRIIEATKPKWAIAENVKNLMSETFSKELDIVLSSLGKAGYNNYIKVLDAKNYGIPQHRERVFIISIRRDIDDYSFCFPQAQELKLRLKDILETEVDEKFYLNNTMKDCFINHSLRMESKGNGFRFSPHVLKNADVAKTILTRAGERPDDNFVIDIESPQKNFTFDSRNLEAKTKGISSNDLRIRKLTPKECFRLMGFDDEDVEILIRNNIAESQIYKMAGNSIVVNVLERIFENLILKKEVEADLLSMMFG